jgi:hypothetical protein
MKRISTLSGALVGLFCSFATAHVSAAEPADDPLLGDTRLAAKCSMRELSVPVRDLLADLNERTGIAFFADSAVADDKITVITHDRPVADTLRGISTLTRYEWARSGKPGAFGYTLRVGEAEAARRARARDQRLTRLADLTMRQVATFRELQPLMEPQWDALEDGLPQKIAAEKDPLKQQALRTQYTVLRELRERNKFRPFVYRLLAALDKTQVLDLLRAGAVGYAWPDAPGCRPLPKDVVREVQQSSPIEGIGSAPGDILSLRARFTVVEGRSSYLRWELIVGRRNFYLSGLSGLVGLMPPELGELEADADGPTAPAGWEKDAKLTTNVTVSLNADESTGNPSLRRTRSYKLSDALEQIDSALPMDMIADALWSTRLAGVNMTKLPVGEALTKLSRTVGHRWWNQDGFILIRSQSYDADREAEPPSTAVARWVAQYDRGLFTLDDLAEIAALPHSQAMTLYEMGSRGVFPMLISPLSSGRSHLQLWNALSLQQRRKAMKAGIGFSELSPAQQGLYVMAASDTSSPVRAAVLDEKALARSHMRVEIREMSGWGVKRAVGTYDWHVPRAADTESDAVSRAQAWKQFAGLDASIKLEEVRSMTKSFALFLCEDERGLLSHFTVAIPPRWGE